MTLSIHYRHWFTVKQWFLHNYIIGADYTHQQVQDIIYITFLNRRAYAAFYTSWQHIICVDND